MNVLVHKGNINQNDPESPPHFYHIGNLQENKNQRLVRTPGERNPDTWWEYKLLHLLWKAVWSFFQTTKIKLPGYPAIPLLGIYPKEYKFA
jgi:hypothetical protein